MDKKETEVLSGGLNQSLAATIIFSIGMGVCFHYNWIALGIISGFWSLFFLIICFAIAQVLKNG